LADTTNVEIWQFQAAPVGIFVIASAVAAATPKQSRFAAVVSASQN
jgi:hypothetical protein